MLLICSHVLRKKTSPNIKGQVAQKVGHKCWQATVLLMLSTLAVRHTHPLRVQEEFLD